MAKLSVELQRFFFEEERSERVSLKEILALAGERIFGFLFVLLALPSALPVPAPGYSIPFGFIMLLLSAQLIGGRTRPWLPRRWREWSMSTKSVQGVMKKGIPWLRRIENLTRPRFTYICVSLPGRIILGSAISLMAISMMIPIPGTNTVPAMGIFVTGFGLLEDDGAISLSGLVICALGLAISISILIAIYFGGTSLIDMLKIWLKGSV